MIEEYGDSLLEQAKAFDMESLQGMRERHFNIAKFLFYCQRLINLGGVVDHNQSTFLYYILSELDEILDIMKYTAADILEFKGEKLHTGTISLLEKIIKQNKNFSEFYYNPDNKNLRYQYKIPASAKEEGEMQYYNLFIGEIGKIEVGGREL